MAVVNKEQSKKFNALVDAAPELIKDLPWGPDFEGALSLESSRWARTDLRDAVGTFQRPDFTALEILAFSTGGIPAGINIPNYAEYVARLTRVCRR